MQGGQWKLLLDDKDDNRNSLDVNVNSGSLAAGAKLEATFDEQLRDGGGKYTLAFKGTIGNEPDIAVAAKSFKDKDEVWQGPYSVPPDTYCAAETGTMTVTFHRPEKTPGILNCTAHYVSIYRDQSHDFTGNVSGSTLTLNGGLFTATLSGATLDGKQQWVCPVNGDKYYGPLHLTRIQ